MTFNSRRRRPWLIAAWASTVVGAVCVVAAPAPAFAQG